MKLHMGCGGVSIPGFVNVDISASSHVHIVADLLRSPFKDKSANLIYSSSVLEHFGRAQWKNVLADWHRILIPGGLLRISTTDFDAMTARYNEEQNLEELLGLLVGGQRDRYDWHGMVFNFALLSKGLTDLGFIEVERYDWRETELGQFGIDDYSQAYLPHMQKDTGRLMVLNVQARKPGLEI